MNPHVFHLATIFFALLLFSIGSKSASIMQPLGYLYVNEELSIDWEYREIPIYDGPAGNMIGSINLSPQWRNWCLSYSKVQGVRRTISPEDSTKFGGCFYNYTFFDRHGPYARILKNTFPERTLWVGMEYALPENPQMRLSLGTSPLDQNSHLRPKPENHTRVYPKPRISPESSNRESRALGYVKFESSYGPGTTWSFDRWFLKEFPVFDAPGGEKIGSFNIGLGLDLCLFNPSIRGVRFQVLNEEVYKLGKCDLFIYYEIREGYVRILDKSVPEGIWIPLEYFMPEDPRVKLSFGTREFLENLDQIPSFYVGNYNGYSLTVRPSSNAAVLVTLDSRLHAFAEFTGEIQGPWAEAIFYRISQYPADEGCYTMGHLEPYKLATYRGWIKLLNDNGTPGDIVWDAVC